MGAFPHTDDWDSAFEADPADGDNLSSGDDEIRKMKVAIRELLDIDHYMDPTDADPQNTHGAHRKIGFQGPIAQPSSVAGIQESFLYVKDVNSKQELHFSDEDDNEVVLTNAGHVMSFPSGTKMVFYQDTAPVGWTIDDTLDDKLLFVTKGSAASGEVGGGVHSTGTWTMNDDHQLTTAEMPSHVHTYYGRITGSGTTRPAGSYFTPHATRDTGSAGGDTAHSHWDSDWRPDACCVIIAEKD